MTDPAETRRVIRRILVALDASAHSLAALEAAVKLAEEVEAELEGVFVEDRGLLRLAGHSLSREIDFLSARLRKLEAEELERQLRLQAALARRRLRESAESRRLEWRFRSVRGGVIPELRTAAEKADLVILGVRGWSPGRGPGSTVRALLEKPATPVMVLGRASRLGRSVFALFGGSKDGEHALELADSIAAGAGLPLTVLLVAENESELERLRDQASTALSEAKEVEYRRLAPGHEGKLADLVAREGCGLFVLARPPMEASGEEGEAVRDLLSRMECPVLLVG